MSSPHASVPGWVGAVLGLIARDCGLTHDRSTDDKAAEDDGSTGHTGETSDTGTRDTSEEGASGGTNDDDAREAETEESPGRELTVPRWVSRRH